VGLASVEARGSFVLSERLAPPTTFCILGRAVANVKGGDEGGFGRDSQRRELCGPGPG